MLIFNDIIFRKVALAPANDGDPTNPLDPDFINDGTIRLRNLAFAYTTKHARLAKTRGADIQGKDLLGKFQRSWWF